ncbi:hypothetical protein ONZ45_g10386 [Pleurotus djamor]|nr:hypothetical protein ONZ45_g10386 [Pleurotus djamor]
MAILTNFAAQSLIDDEIDAEMERHWDLLKRLWSQRNTHCAVNQLPTDVLEHIFFFIKDDAESIEPFPCEAYSEWTVLLYVPRLVRHHHRRTSFMVYNRPKLSARIPNASLLELRDNKKPSNDVCI